MMNLDTLSLSFSESAFRDLDLSKWNQSIISGAVGADGERMEQGADYTLPDDERRKYLGLGTIKIRASQFGISGKVSISGKVLRRDYFRLLNKDTIEQAIDNISGPHIRWNTPGLLESVVCRADPCSNLKVSRPVGEYIGTLRNYKCNTRYIPKPYDNDGFTFIKDNKTHHLKDRLIFYDKHREVFKDKSLQGVVSASDFEGVLRVESNIRHFEQARRLLGLGDGEPTLKAVLNSESKPNLELFEDIACIEYEQLALFNGYEGLSISRIEREEGMRNIIKTFRYDLRLIYQWIRDRSANNSYQYRRYRDKVRELLGQDKERVKAESILINEMRELLKAA